MVARPGKLQAVFSAGEIGPRFDQRTGLKYHAAGLKQATRIELLPQGGFTLTPGLRHIGDTAITSERIIPFAALNGNVYDLVLNAAQVEVWGEAAKLYQFNHVYSATQVREVLFTQDLDTLLTFHEDVAPWRMVHGAPTTWAVGDAPLTDVPNYDYGAVYVNGVASEFELEFIGFHEGAAPYWDNIAFTITVNNQETRSIRGESTAPPAGTTPDMTVLAANIEAAILQLPNVQPGVTVSVVSATAPFRVKIVFGGTENLGDVWGVSGRVVNKSDAALLTNKTVVGVAPGEPIVSAARGWPRCGTFYQQSLLLGGFKSLPNAWMKSITGRYFDFDQRLSTADGSFVIPLNIPGGERIENIVNNQFLLVMTSERNYWVAGSQNGLSKTAPPKHVPATDHGVAAHVPVVDNEGAAVYVHKSGDFIGEMRYTDIDGNYTATDLSLLGYHLVEDVVDIAVKRKASKQSANMAAVVNADGKMRGIFLLREQELTGFSRLDTEGLVKACAVNNRNELTVIVERARGAGVARTVERQENGLLLDAAMSFVFPYAVTLIAGLSHLEGQEVWALADGHVLGPYTVEAGQIEIEIAARAITVGRWVPPRAETLPFSRMVGPDIWLQKKSRIHTVQVFVENTTSIAFGCNGGKIYDYDLRRFGQVPDVPELEAGYTGLIKLSGFGGFVDEPTLVITQLRPGRMTVKSVITEAAI
jgi:hypothetical protein